MLVACSFTLEVTYPQTAVAPPTKPNGRVQCSIYQLPEVAETPKPPVMDWSGANKITPTDQKISLVQYIEQLRIYIASLKNDARVSYMRYLSSCAD